MKADVLEQEDHRMADTSIAARYKIAEEAVDSVGSEAADSLSA